MQGRSVTRGSNQAYVVNHEQNGFEFQPQTTFHDHTLLYPKQAALPSYTSSKLAIDDLPNLHDSSSNNILCTKPSIPSNPVPNIFSIYSLLNLCHYCIPATHGKPFNRQTTASPSYGPKQERKKTRSSQNKKSTVYKKPTFVLISLQPSFCMTNFYFVVKYSKYLCMSRCRSRMDDCCEFVKVCIIFLFSFFRRMIIMMMTVGA